MSIKNIRRGIYPTAFSGSRSYEVANGYPNASLVLSNIKEASEYCEKYNKKVKAKR